MSEDEKQTDGLEPLPYAESSALLDALFDCAPVGIGFWDTELRFRRQPGPGSTLTLRNRSIRRSSLR